MPSAFLPAFWDDITAFLAIDLEAGMRNRVVAIEFVSDKAFREVCGSFEAFLSEATRAIQEDDAPAFLKIISSFDRLAEIHAGPAAGIGAHLPIR